MYALLVVDEMGPLGVLTAGREEKVGEEAVGEEAVGDLGEEGEEFEDGREPLDGRDLA